jgi:hypothetical protein
MAGFPDPSTSTSPDGEVPRPASLGRNSYRTNLRLMLGGCATEPVPSIVGLRSLLSRAQAEGIDPAALYREASQRAGGPVPPLDDVLPAPAIESP